MLPECPSEMGTALEISQPYLLCHSAITEIFLPAGAHLKEDLESG